MIKIILDTNVFVSGAEDIYHFGKRIVDLVLEGKIKALTSAEIEKENNFILGKRVTDETYKKWLRGFFEKAENVKVVKNFRAVKDDHEDDKFIDAAVAGRADFIITEDKHLLDIGEFKSVKIVKPSEFWGIWRAREENSQEEWRKFAQSIGIGSK